MAERRIAMVAGEPSGDLLAGLLLAGMRARLPVFQAYGIGGAHMQAQGFDAQWPMDKLAVHGYWDALKHYREIKGIRDAFGDRLIAAPPDIFIGTDAPDFNLGLEQRLRGAGVRTVHFVSPSIWAWRGKRIETIRAAADLVLCLFPFEPAIYERAGIPAAYVGHPLADVIPLEPDPAAARRRLGLAPEAPVVAVLPGSRHGELARIGPAFIDAMQIIAARMPQVRFVVPMATASLRAHFDRLMAERPDAGALPLTITDGDSHAVIESADTVLVASGTATLECALFKKPMVIAYRVAWLSYQIMRHMAYLPWIGLPNILLNDTAVPEFIQDRATPQALAEAVLAQLHDPAGRARLAQRFMAMHQSLRCGTGERAAEAICALMERPR
jgi:lipid-A-disaccharide synthase